MTWDLGLDRGETSGALTAQPRAEPAAGILRRDPQADE